MPGLEVDYDLVLGARRQVGGGLRLGAPQQEVAHAPVEPPEGGGIALVELAAEGGLGAEEPRLGEGEEAPKVAEAVLHRRAREDEPVAGREGARGRRHLARGVLDELALVEHDDVPGLRLEPIGVEAQLGVVRDQQGGFRCSSLRRRCNRIERRHPQARGEARGLGQPAVRHALGAHHQGAEAFRGAVSRQVQEPGERLHRLAETHVVGEHAAEALRGEVGEELVTFDLIRPQRRGESRRRRGRRPGGKLGQPALEFGGEPGVAAFERCGLRGELQRVHTVGRLGARLEDVVHGEAQAVQGGGRGVARLGCGDLEAFPA